MLSFTLVHWLMISNAVLLVLLALVVVQAQVRQNRQAQSMNDVINNIQQTQNSLTQSTLGMGRRLQAINDKLHKTEQRILLPHADEAVLAQAARLVQLGASASDLVESCGVPRAEAELMVSLQNSALIRH